MKSKNIQLVGGISAIFEAIIYIIAFIVYGGVLVYPKTDATALEKLDFLSENYSTLSILNLMCYVLFGILLAVLVLAIHQRLKSYSNYLSNVASVFGVIWVGLVMASGMIANIGLNTVVDLGAQDAENAMLLWSSIGVVTEGLGGGNELIGGLWVLLVSIIGLKANVFSVPLNYLGLLVGIVGILTIYPLDLFTEVFGLCQIIWFLWIGVYMIRSQVHVDMIQNP